jgi:hypothetical protein
MNQGERTVPFDTLAELPEATAQVHPEMPARRTLADSLGPTADRIRQIRTDLGFAPYRVYLVHWRWPGKVGLGRPVEISRVEILPTPKVSDMNSTNLMLAAFGATEGGGIFLSKISTKFSEDDLAGKTPDMRDLVRTNTAAYGVEFFYEVRLNRPGSKPRRYSPSGVPNLDKNGLHWHLNLIKQSTSYDPVDVVPEVAS